MECCLQTRKRSPATSLMRMWSRATFSGQELAKKPIQTQQERIGESQLVGPVTYCPVHCLEHKLALGSVNVMEQVAPVLSESLLMRNSQSRLHPNFFSDCLSVDAAVVEAVAIVVVAVAVAVVF